MTTTQDLYSRLVIIGHVCASATLSPTDRTAFTEVLNFFRITSAKTFAAKVSVVFGGGNAATYPTIVPFSYSFDESKNTWTDQVVLELDLPWQPIGDQYNITLSYLSSSQTSINTIQLAKGVIEQIAGADAATSLVSAAAANYLNAAANIVNGVVPPPVSTSNNKPLTLDIVTGRDRGIIYRLKDANNKPLAAVELVLVLTNSLANPVPFTDYTGSTTPKFSHWPSILSDELAGPLGGTLGDDIAKEQSYKTIISADQSTAAIPFAQACNDLQAVVRDKYALNRYDEAIAMGEILSSSSTYFSNANLTGSQCFKDRTEANISLLGEMGLQFGK